MKKIILIMLTFSVSLYYSKYNLYSQDNINIDGKVVTLNNEFKVEKLSEIPNEQSMTTIKGYRYKELFNQLLAKDGVLFFHCDYGLIAQYKDSYYLLNNKNNKFTSFSIGFFFKSIDSPQKAKDIVYFLNQTKGRIVESKIFYDKYLEEMGKTRPDLIVNKNLPFQEFKAEFLAGKYYHVKLTLFSVDGMTVEQYVVDAEGHVAYLGSAVVTKSVNFISGAALISPEQSNYIDIEKITADYALEQEKKTNNEKSVFYSNKLNKEEIKEKSLKYLE